MLLGVLVAAFAACVALTWLVLPGEANAEQRRPFWGRNIAHRGLHSRAAGRPENSLAAFTAAVDGGYAIELDIQLTKDGKIVVFHDDDLERVCGAPGRLDAHSYEELSALRLFDSDQGIPLFEDVLALVDGQVPLVIELKTSPRQKQLTQSAWQMLRLYDGDICIESFDPRIVWRFKRYVPGLLRGQLAAPPKELKKGFIGCLIGWGLANFMGRPNFIAYRKGPRPPFIRLAQRLCMSVVWTATPDDDTTQLEMDSDAVIFEGYQPEPRYMEPPDEPENDPAKEDYSF